MYIRTKDSINGCKGSPYYIGKGKNNRAFDFSAHRVKCKKDGSNVRFIKENLSEDDALMWEAFWIAEFGRIDLGTGCLHNRTDGGEIGPKGFIPKYKGKSAPWAGKTFIEKFGEIKAAEIGKKISAKKSGKQNYFYGKKPEGSHKENLIKSITGRAKSAEEIQKIKTTKENSGWTMPDEAKMLISISNSKLSIEEIDVALDLIEEGLSCAKIARMLNCSAFIIQRIKKGESKLANERLKLRTSFSG